MKMCFEAKVKEAKLFLLCSLHNPAGRAWDKEELKKFVNICIANDVQIVSDEIYADIVYGKSFVHCDEGFMRLYIATLCKVQYEVMQRLEKAYREMK